MDKDMKFCQSCGMPLTDDVLGTNADGSKNEDYCMYCYKDGKFLQDCTMDEMIEHCAQFVGAVNEGLPNPITKEEYIGQMKTYFPNLKRWRKALNVTNDEAMKVNPALAGVKELIAQMADSLPIAYISSVDSEGYPYTKAMRHVSWIYCRRKYSFYVKLKLKSGKRLTRPLGQPLSLQSFSKTSRDYE